MYITIFKLADGLEIHEIKRKCEGLKVEAWY